MNNYYVYKHTTKDTNKLFYIGKGIGRRAYDLKSGRNKFWKNMVKKYGYIIEFIQQNMSEEDALVLEKELIGQYKPKANLSAGGRGGATGYKHNRATVLKRNENDKRINATPEGN